MTKTCCVCSEKVVPASQSFFQLGLERKTVCEACYRKINPSWPEGIKS